MRKLLLMCISVMYISLFFISFPAMAESTGLYAHEIIINGDFETNYPTSFGVSTTKYFRTTHLAHSGTTSLCTYARFKTVTSNPSAAPYIEISSYLKELGAGSYQFGFWIKTTCLTTISSAGTLTEDYGTGNLSITGIIRANSGSSYSFSTTGTASTKDYGSIMLLSSGNVPVSYWQHYSYTFTVTDSDISKMTAAGTDCYVRSTFVVNGPSYDIYVDDMSLTKELDSSQIDTDNSACGMLTNGGFEQGSINWSAYQGGALSIISYEAHSGLFAARYNRTSVNSSISYNVTSLLSSHGRGTYQLSFWAKLDDNAPTATQTFTAFFTAGTTLYHKELGTVVLNKKSWTQFTAAFTISTDELMNSLAPATNAVVFRLQGPGGIRYSSYYIDDVSLSYEAPPTPTPSPSPTPSPLPSATPTARPTATPTAAPSGSFSIHSSISDENTLSVNLDNTNSAYKYQIWYYAKVTDPTNAGSSYYVWTLVSSTGSISASVADAVPAADGKYKIMVVTVDSSGNAVQTQYDDVISLGDVELGTPKIRSIQVNGAALRGTVIINKDTTDTATIQINAANATSYEMYTLDGIGGRTDITVAPDGSATIDFSTLAAGNYTFTAVAKATDKTSDTATVTFEVYSPAANGSTIFPEINSFTYGMTANILTVNVTPKAAGNYWYNIGNAWTQNPEAVTRTFPAGAYGNYTTTVWVRRSKSAQKADDGFRRTLTYARPDATLGVSATYGITYKEGNPTTGVNAGDQVDFAATGTVTNGTLRSGEELQYRFVRNDARDWVVIKDWSTDNTLAWTPALTGNYTIRVDVKGSLSGEYEALAAYQFSVAGSTKAQGTLTLADISGAKARTPIELSAAVTGGSSSDVLQYRYDIIDAQMGRVVAQAYSADNTYTWIPRKAGTYTVEVKVINQNSFGQYDLIDSQEVTVG